MTMTMTQAVITVGLVILGTVLTRFTPYILFPEGRPVPKFIQYLGKTLGPAVFGLLCVYCFRNVDWTTPLALGGTHGIPEAIACAVTVGAYCWKRQMILSMAAGTVVYMLLVQLVF